MKSLLLTLALVLTAAPAAAQNIAAPADSMASAQVTYVSGGSIYVDAGREDGLGVGQRVTVYRGGDPVTEVTVEHLASHRAACVLAPGSPEVEIGDRVQFAVPRARPPAPATPPAAAAAATPARRPATTGLRALGLRGRVGLRVLALQDRTQADAGFTQPAIDLQVRGTRVGGSGVDLEADVRSRRTYRDVNGISQTEGLTRVYRLQGAYAPPGTPWRFSLGRQVSPNLASVSLFDGATAAWRRGRLDAGVFAGTQPDGTEYAFSTDILEFGGYARLNGTEGNARWSATLGAISSRDGGEPNRDYLFLRGEWSGPRISAWVDQEMDVNRGWKQDAEESAVSFTSTYASLRGRLAEPLTLSAGLDNRRNVRLYRDRETPETTFDDSYRQGWWAGVEARSRARVTGSLTWRQSAGGSGGTSRSGTLSLRASRLPVRGIDLGLRGTRFRSDASEGWLCAVNGSGRPFPNHRLDVHGGYKSEDRTWGSTVTRVETPWYGADYELGFARNWYLLVSLEATNGDIERNTELFTSLSYRF